MDVNVAKAGGNASPEQKLTPPKLGEVKNMRPGPTKCDRTPVVSISSDKLHPHRRDVRHKAVRTGYFRTVSRCSFTNRKRSFASRESDTS